MAKKQSPKKKPAARSPAKSQAARPAEAPHRKAVVFVSLVGVLTFTTALLLALSPAPLPQHDQTLWNQGRSPAAQPGTRDELRVSTTRD